MSTRLPLRLEPDDTGRLRARWDGPGPLPDDARLLVEFLESDIAHDMTYPTRIREEADLIAAGQSRGWNCTGNAFALAMAPERTRLIRLWPDPDDEERDDAVELETPLFLAVLDLWTRAVRTHLDLA